MNSNWALVGAGVLIGVLAFLLLGGETPVEPEDPALGPDAGVPAGTSDPGMKVDDAGLTGHGTGAVKPKRRSHSPFKPYTPRTGTLEIRPLGLEDQVVSADDCTVSLERVKPATPMGKLGHRDRKTGVWRFEKVAIGRVRVVITGDHLITTRKVVKVRENSVTYYDVLTEPGALIRFSAKRIDGTVPKKATFELLDSSGKPTSVYWQVRGTRHYSSPTRTASFTQHPEGVAFSVPAGVYTLRARTEDEFDGAVDVTVAAGDTSEVALELTR